MDMAQCMLAWLAETAAAYDDIRGFIFSVYYMESV
jgi:hypothetical protein